MSNLSEDPALVAKARGLVLVLPGARDVFIDIDDDASLAIFDGMMGVLASNCGMFPLREVKRTKSEHGNTHIYLEASRDLSDVERIVLQACLGSDRKRELLSMLRLEVNSPFPASTFFEVPVPDPPGAGGMNCDKGEKHETADRVRATADARDRAGVGARDSA